MVPVINALLHNNFEVIIGADKHPLQLLRSEFPQLPYVVFPSYSIKYSGTKSLVWVMLKQAPWILFGIYKEHNALKKIIREQNIDIVISDNRFGLWNRKIYTIFITHQLMIKMPQSICFFEFPVSRINNFFIKKYNKCWVPDYDEGMCLSGQLSHKYPLLQNTFFIGHLSRFHNLVQSQNTPEVAVKHDILAVLSGPEPQRTIFEKILIDKFKQTSYSVLIVRGIPGESAEINITEKIKIIPYMGSMQLSEAMMNAEHIICRSGYSSIMDFVAMKKKAILVPTPGQTEQEYLAEYLFERGWFCHVNQYDFDLEEAIKISNRMSPEFPDFSGSLLDMQINSLIMQMRCPSVQVF
ncbi:MAG: glycosyltransferase [Bacteroidia bacterium]|nr:glycosyltransferase [Bacteroidia bacterium]